MKLIYLSSYSLVYPEVLKTLNNHFSSIQEIIFYKKGLIPNTTNKKLIFFKKILELQIKMVNPSIFLTIEKIPQEQKLLTPETYRDYIESLISTKYSSFSPKETIFLIETLDINKMKWKLEKLSTSYTFILFTNKHKKNLDLSLGGQNWKRIHMLPAETETILSNALRKSYKEENADRFDHTLRVIEFANQLSLWCSLDETTRAKLLLSCAYHDFAKNWTKSQLLSYATKIYSKSKEELETEVWSLHGPVAKYYLSNKIKLDESVLTAIEFHTKPTNKLDIVGKLLVIADKLEPEKKKKFPPEQYETLWNKLMEGKYEEVFDYLLKNSIKS